MEDWGEHGGSLYLVLEYVEGQVLTERISTQAPSLTQVYPYLEKVLDALIYAHDRGVVHRDLKPDNIMITTTGEVKLMDFGLARGEEGDKVTQTGSSMGTPAYIPPEQITGARPTPAADQYSLGVILYEFLTGHRPFKEKNPLKLLMQHLSEVPVDPLKLNPELPPSCGAILLRMLEKSPEQRFESLRVVQEGLAALARGEAWEVPKRPMNPEEIRTSRVEVVLPNSTTQDDETTGFQVTGG